MRVTLVVLVSFGAAAVAPAAATASPTPVTVYLERNGKTVTARSGADIAIPRFGGGDRAWTQLVACVKDRFAPFQVSITDRKPGRGDHITALIGGRASLLGLNDRTTNGIGPYSGEVLPNATVHVFSQVGTGERDVDNLCAVTAHEVGHALGLDHSNLCGDIMSYYNDECGTQQFLDATAACGETSDRDCANGDATQNSYRRLAAHVGLRPGAPRTGPKAPGSASTDDSLDQSDGTTDSSDDDGTSDDDWDWSDDSSSDDSTDDVSIDDATTAPPTTAPQTTAPQTNPSPAPQTPDPWAGDTDAFSDDDDDSDDDTSDADTGDADAGDDDAGFDTDTNDDADTADDDSADANAADASASDDAPTTSPTPADPYDSDEADEQPEQRAPRWNPRRDGRRDGRRDRWQRTDAERPHCGQ